MNHSIGLFHMPCENTMASVLFMKKHRPKSENNRLEILRQSYRMMVQSSWEGISVADLEKQISQTRGAIFYFNKNKEDLFHNMMDELFFPVFALSQELRDSLKNYSDSDLLGFYKTPFERVRDYLKHNHGIKNAAQAIFNLFIQGSRHYKNFTKSINDLMIEEVDFMSKIIGGRVGKPIDLNKIYIENIGKIFVESISTKEI